MEADIVFGDAAAAFRAAWLLAGSYAIDFLQVFDLAGTVGWARTTDLLFHRQAIYHPI
jgi:hypothetical protein